MTPSRQRRLFEVLSSIVARVPVGALIRPSELAASVVGPRIMGDKAELLQRHLDRVGRWNGSTAASSSEGFGSYGRYWAETLRLPTLQTADIDRGFSFVGYEKIVQVRQEGLGPLIVLPHLGGWEWAAAWLVRVANVPVTAVVERLEPEDVYDWFVSLRASYGINVVPLGPGSFGQLLEAVRSRDVVCLLSDRDISGTGRTVEFFGDETTVPVGPVVLSRRTGSPLMPTAVFFDGRRRLCVVGDPIYPEDRSAEEMLSEMVTALERLISSAPDQWHILEPNWPGD